MVLPRCPKGQGNNCSQENQSSHPRKLLHSPFTVTLILCIDNKGRDAARLDAREKTRQSMHGACSSMSFSKVKGFSCGHSRDLGFQLISFIFTPNMCWTKVQTPIKGDTFGWYIMLKVLTRIPQIWWIIKLQLPIMLYVASPKHFYLIFSNCESNQIFAPNL